MGLQADYELLGFKFGDASPNELTACYRGLSKTAHPDGGGSMEGFVRLRDAYTEAYKHATGLKCSGCLGVGEVAVMTPGSFHSTRRQCRQCKGSGRKYPR